MLSALFSFLGGAAFRYLVGEAFAYLNARQGHQHEVERMRLQMQLDAQAHAQRREIIELEAARGVQLIRVQAEADGQRSDAEAFVAAVRAIGQPVGIAWVDGWNAAIRPGLATISVYLVVADAHGWLRLSDRGWEVAGAALGLFVADRLLFKRGR